MADATPQIPAPLLVSAREAAAALGICERTLHTLTKSADVPCVRIGRRVLYAPRDLADWVDRRKEGAR